jgi:hypothetical protein
VVRLVFDPLGLIKMLFVGLGVGPIVPCRHFLYSLWAPKFDAVNFYTRKRINCVLVLM